MEVRSFQEVSFGKPEERSCNLGDNNSPAYLLTDLAELEIGENKEIASQLEYQRIQLGIILHQTNIDCLGYRFVKRARLQIIWRIRSILLCESHNPLTQAKSIAELLKSKFHIQSEVILQLPKDVHYL